MYTFCKQKCLQIVYTGFLLLCGCGGGPSPEPDVLYVVPGSHLDIGFTDTPTKVRAKRIATLNAALDAMEEDADFRWTEEASWVVHAWMKKNPDRVSTLKKRVAEGRLGIGATYVNPHAAVFPRGLHHLFAFGEFRSEVAVLNDVPAFPEALVDAAAAAGVKAFLLGVNLGFSEPLPDLMTSAPFRWRSSKGSEVVVSIDPHSYTSAYTRWGIEPSVAKFMARDRYGDRSGMELAEWAVGKMWERPVVVQHAFDNWDAGPAKKLPAFIRDWNAGNRTPRIELATPAVLLSFRDLPVREGEWGGEWGVVRAGCPVSTALLRRASEQAKPSLDVAAAMGHTGGLGPGWPDMFTEEQTKQHNREWAAMFRRAIGRAPAWPAATIPRGGPGLVVAPSALGGPHFPAGSKVVSTRGGVIEEGNRRIYRARLDRTAIPGDDKGNVDVGWDIPLPYALSEISVPGKWLKGKPPAFFIAPYGLTLRTPKGRLTVRSDLAFTYRLVERDGKARLQALLVRQSRLCELKGGGRKVLDFADLYPGEPAVLDAALVLTFPRE